MPGLAELALGAAPIAGGALLGAVAGNLKPPDIRGLIAKDLDLLDRIPEEQTARRAAFQRMIDQRIDDLVASSDRGRSLREAASSYGGGWRDVLVFIGAVLFTVIWWNVEHTRSNWLIMFLVMLALTLVAGFYAARTVLRSLQGLGGRLRRRSPKSR
ncbi:ABC-type antimicrobial peptide transport system permease subunit [Mycobacteroides chelonae]|nr:ABC-type antimicrobial peptide transport system permease subunit [Mycobacteroides chelonae]